jgi:hypothetical protein
VQAIRLSATTAVLAVLAAGATAAPARAQHPPAPFCPPDQSVAALDQYCESLPEAGGPVSSQTGGRPASSTPLGRVLPARAVTTLRAIGGAGGRALLLMPVVAPIGSSPAARAQRRLVRRFAPRVAAEDLSAKPVAPGTVLRGLAGARDAVLSGAFRWGLLVCTLGFAGIGWLRIRAKL